MSYSFTNNSVLWAVEQPTTAYIQTMSLSPDGNYLAFGNAWEDLTIVYLVVLIYSNNLCESLYGSNDLSNFWDCIFSKLKLSFSCWNNVLYHRKFSGRRSEFKCYRFKTNLRAEYNSLRIFYKRHIIQCPLIELRRMHSLENILSFWMEWLVYYMGCANYSYPCKWNLLSLNGLWYWFRIKHRHLVSKRWIIHLMRPIANYRLRWIGFLKQSPLIFKHSLWSLRYRIEGYLYLIYSLCYAERVFYQYLMILDSWLKLLIG